jgi:hypothetical protein
MESFIYVGLLTDSASRNYPSRQYSHTETIKGKDVEMYHCWRKDYDHVTDPFGEDLDVKKTKEFDRWIRDNPTDL